MVLKQVVLIALITLIAVTPSFAVELPNYTKNAKAIFSITCDAGKSIATSFIGSSYRILEIKAQYENILIQLTRGTNDYFLLRGIAGEGMVEVSHDSWDAKLKKVAPNLFMDLHSF